MAGPLIAAALGRVAATLRRSNHLQGLPREAFAARAADIMVAINGAHPFREGNGRTQRVFVRELAKEAGHELDFSVVTRERMIAASIAGNERGDGTMMPRLFNEISDPVRVAALEQAIGSLSRNGFAWNDHYIATLHRHGRAGAQRRADHGRHRRRSVHGPHGDRHSDRTGGRSAGTSTGERRDDHCPTDAMAAHAAAFRGRCRREMNLQQFHVPYFGNSAYSERMTYATGARASMIRQSATVPCRHWSISCRNSARNEVRSASLRSTSARWARAM